MKAKSLSALFATLSPSPRTVFGIQSVLSKHLENRVTITLLGIMAVPPCVIHLKSAPTLGSLSTWTQELSQELLMCQATKLRVLSYIDFLASAPLTF